MTTSARTSKATGQEAVIGTAAVPQPVAEPRYVAVRVGPQTTTDGCVRLDRAPRQKPARAQRPDRNKA